MVELAPTTRLDITRLSASLRAADRVELEASTGGPLADIVANAVERTPEPLTATDPQGNLVALFGCAPIGTLLTTYGSPWLLGTELLTSHAGALIKLSRSYVERWREEYPQLVNYVDARNAASIRYLKAVGFTLDEALPFGRLGFPFHRFHVGLQDSV